MKNFSSKNNNRDYPNRRWVLLAFSLISVSLSSGVVYGWPALRYSLLNNDNSLLSEKALDTIYTLGAWTAQGGRFYWGLARDKFGTRAVTSAAMICVVIGALGVALCGPNDTVGLSISLAFLGMGSGVQLALQPVAGLFTQNEGTVMSSISGAFQISGLVFLILTSGAINRRLIFTGYAMLISVLVFIAILILPSGKSFNLDDEVPVLEPDELLLSSKKRRKSLSASAPSASSQLRSLEYCLLTFWFSACVLPLQYYIGTIGFQLESKGDVDGYYTYLQQITYAGSAIVSPVLGLFADKFGLGVAQGTGTLLSALSLLILSNDSIPLNMQVLGLMFYAVGRMLIFTMYFTNIGQRFGYHNFGTLVGIGLVTSAIVSLLQYPLIDLAGITRFSEMNIACGGIFVVLLPYCVWLNAKEKREKFNDNMDRTCRIADSELV